MSASSGDQDQSQDLRSLASRLVAYKRARDPRLIADDYEAEVVTEQSYDSLKGIQSSKEACLARLRILVQAYSSTGSGKQKADDYAPDLSVLEQTVDEYGVLTGLANQQYLEPAELFTAIGDMETYQRVNAELRTIADNHHSAMQAAEVEAAGEDEETANANLATASSVARSARCLHLRSTFPAIAEALELHRTLDLGEEETDNAIQELELEASDLVDACSLGEEEDALQYQVRIRAAKRNLYARQREARVNFRASGQMTTSPTTASLTNSEATAGAN